MPYSGIIIGVALGVLLVIMSAATIRLWIADLMKWRNWRKSKQSALSSEEFITCVRSYNFHRSQVRFISTVRTKGLLLASHNTEEAIYNFAREIELQTLSTDQASVADRIVWIATSIVKQMRRLIHYESENSLPKNEYEYGVGVLDEVLRLLEQIRTAA
jgi:hypothetical protein